MRIAPGALIAAAFIGPGTVTTATLAGATYGYVLLWGIATSAIATMVLQEMAMRIGVVGRRDLGQAIRVRLAGSWLFYAAAALIVLAIFVGNAAYEGGNLTGAVLGLELVLPDPLPRVAVCLAIGALAAALLHFGAQTGIKLALSFAVVAMSFVYLGALFVVPVDWAALLLGLVPYRLPSGAELQLIGLIGTTVVPYNLFLHAATARDHYADGSQLSRARWDTHLSIALGSVITLAIAVLAAATTGAGVGGLGEAGGVVAAPAPQSALDLVEPLRAALGPAAKFVVGFGYFAAGLSSALTAPLAAAYALSGLFGWRDTDGRAFTAAWATVLAFGLAVVLFGTRPVALILLAQAANGLLLPIIAAFVVWIANDRALLGERRNGWFANGLGGAILLLTLILSAKTLYGLL